MAERLVEIGDGVGGHGLVRLFSREDAKAPRIVVVYDAPRTLFEGWRAEVHQYAQGQIHQAKICQDLLAVDGHAFFGGFQLDEQSFLDEQIVPESVLEYHAIKADFDRLLPVNLSL